MIIGAGLKMYLGHWETVDWLDEVAQVAERHPGLRRGAVELFVLPTFPTLVHAVRRLSRLGVGVGAQDLFWEDRGPYTGEVSGAELAELGCRFVEVGHLERRRHFGETDEVVAAKTAAAFRNRLTPVICVGESRPMAPDDAARECTRQLDAVLRDSRRDGTVRSAVVAYEPHWAIGAAAAADADHIRTVCTRLRSVVRAESAMAGSRVVYGGSAGTGLLTELGGAADGLFLGRASHDPDVLEAVLDEATALAPR
ncbi:triose-phosphate isomerase family protein [Geodermatophilus chilensis]|uniref:triose-phosphate isomerase family protein n=1 Tax=Geodermatophilus chilensis TaxID=2035835 RepID=UPI0018E4187D|nr:triose-phosphate isomerase family protein [Geodermatophilus chilensis]